MSWGVRLEPPPQRIRWKEIKDGLTSTSCARVRTRAHTLEAVHGLGWGDGAMGESAYDTKCL